MASPVAQHPPSPSSTPLDADRPPSPNAMLHGHHGTRRASVVSDDGHFVKLKKPSLKTSAQSLIDADQPLSDADAMRLAVDESNAAFNQHREAFDKAIGVAEQEIREKALTEAIKDAMNEARGASFDEEDDDDDDLAREEAREAAMEAAGLDARDTVEGPLSTACGKLEARARELAATLSEEARQYNKRSIKAQKVIYEVKREQLRRANATEIANLRALLEKKHKKEMEEALAEQLRLLQGNNADVLAAAALREAQLKEEILMLTTRCEELERKLAASEGMVTTTKRLLRSSEEEVEELKERLLMAENAVQPVREQLADAETREAAALESAKYHEEEANELRRRLAMAEEELDWDGVDEGVQTSKGPSRVQSRRVSREYDVSERIAAAVSGHEAIIQQMTEEREATAIATEAAVAAAAASAEEELARVRADVERVRTEERAIAEERLAAQRAELSVLSDTQLAVLRRSHFEMERELMHELWEARQAVVGTLGATQKVLLERNASEKLLSTEVAQLEKEVKLLRKRLETNELKTARNEIARLQSEAARWEAEAARLGAELERMAREIAEGTAIVNEALRSDMPPPGTVPQQQGMMSITPLLRSGQFASRTLLDGTRELADRLAMAMDSLDHVSEQLKHATEELVRVSYAAQEQRVALVQTALQSLLQLRQHLSTMHAFQMNHGRDAGSVYRRAQASGMLRTITKVERAPDTMIHQLIQKGISASDTSPRRFSPGAAFETFAPPIPLPAGQDLQLRPGAAEFSERPFRLPAYTAPPPPQKARPQSARQPERFAGMAPTPPVSLSARRPAPTPRPPPIEPRESTGLQELRVQSQCILNV